ncbi:TIGR04086 family membrane protein [Paenibacillus thalictri]|uniref:TIGR04086 family membrane protein n=1 Tax=Paenibacillus thalictri TaxID=2527873 RepID=A0A4Q9E1X7_9BACL|nr:TIGR04086 family membrane protein [Paenibacillus thalictri]TBL81601.1 TIGR04086 family membrane protein [Paenibacillus thalictri]
MIPMNKMKQVRPSSPVLSGLLYSLVTMTILTLLTSLILFSTNMKESSLIGYAYGIHAISLFLGGVIAGKRSESSGWYHGGLLGLLYSVIIFIVAFLAYDAGFSKMTLYLLGLTFASGALGGMIGVNMRK